MAPTISEIELSMSNWSIEELRVFFCCVRASEIVPVPDNTKDLVVVGYFEFISDGKSALVGQWRQQL